MSQPNIQKTFEKQLCSPTSLDIYATRTTAGPDTQTAASTGNGSNTTLYEPTAANTLPTTSPHAKSRGGTQSWLFDLCCRHCATQQLETFDHLLRCQHPTPPHPTHGEKVYHTSTQNGKCLQGARDAFLVSRLRPTELPIPPNLPSPFYNVCIRGQGLQAP